MSSSSSSEGPGPLLSSCEPHLLVPDGRQPIGVAQQLGHEYPLVQPSSDVRYLIADAYLNFDDPADYDSSLTEYTLPFSIKWLYGFGCDDAAKPAWAPDPIHYAEILIVDADDRTVFDSTVASSHTEDTWSDRLNVHEWKTDDSIMKLVVHTKWQEDYVTPQDYPVHLAPTSAVLDERAVERQPKRLKSLLVGLQNITGDDIELQAGYNIDLIDQGAIEEASPLAFVGGQISGGITSLRAGHRLELSGAPGGGLGLFPGCGELDTAVRTINGIPANEHGDWLLIPEQCYWYERPSTVIRHGDIYNRRIVQVTQNTIQLHNNCVPCCECEDFVEVKLAVDAQYDEWRTIGQGAEQTRDLYKDNRDRWLEQKLCREDQPQRLNVEAHCSSYISIGYTFCNTGLECVGPLEVIFEVTTYGYSPGETASETALELFIVPNRTRKNTGTTHRMYAYTLGGSYPTYTAHWESLDSHTPGLLKFMLRSCDAVDGDSIEIKATATLAEQTFDPVSKLVAFEGACDTTDDCASEIA